MYSIGGILTYLVLMSDNYYSLITYPLHKPCHKNFFSHGGVHRVYRT